MDDTLRIIQHLYDEVDDPSFEQRLAEDETLSGLREQLEEKRAEIANKSKLALEEIRQENERGGRDTGDESTEQQETTDMMRHKDREKKYLTKINQALERLGDGTYGECMECGEPIPEGRLKARPAAVLCIECKERKEQEEERKKSRPGLMDDFSM